MHHVRPMRRRSYTSVCVTGIEDGLKGRLLGLETVPCLKLQFQLDAGFVSKGSLLVLPSLGRMCFFPHTMDVLVSVQASVRVTPV